MAGLLPGAGERQRDQRPVPARFAARRAGSCWSGTSTTGTWPRSSRGSWCSPPRPTAWTGAASGVLPPGFPDPGERVRDRRPTSAHAVAPAAVARHARHASGRRAGAPDGVRIASAPPRRACRAVCHQRCRVRRRSSRRRRERQSLHRNRFGSRSRTQTRIPARSALASDLRSSTRRGRHRPDAEVGLHPRRARPSRRPARPAWDRHGAARLELGVLRRVQHPRPVPVRKRVQRRPLVRPLVRRG